MNDLPRRVGPVLQTGVLADAVLDALRELNPGLEVVDRGSYVRARAPASCRLTRSAVEERTGAPFVLPGDLERIMPSFEGRVTFTEQEARWEVAK